MNTDIINELKFDGNGLIPAVIQDNRTDQVLMMAYMNRESLELTLTTGKTHFWSRSRGKLWNKGETSGHFQFVKSILADCDRDTLLIKVEQIGPACHTGNYSCFHASLQSAPEAELPAPVENLHETEGSDEDHSTVLRELYGIVSDRLIHPKEGSYTNYLFEKGLDKILKKVGEETAEVIIAAKNNVKDEIRYEIADLVYHLFVLMVKSGMQLDDLYTELQKRR